MKQIFTFLILSFVTFESIAQMHISTNFSQLAIFNEKTREYDLIGEKEEITFFEFNKQFTFFKHTTPTITSAYTIKSSKEDKVNERWEFDIMSDVGNSYYMILDLKNNNIRFIYTKNGSTYLLQFSIKKLWFEE